MKAKNNFFKQLISIMTVLSLLFMVLGIQGNNEVKAATLATPPAPINQIFPDADLAEGIRAVLQKASVTDVVTQEELESITKLVVAGEKVASIQGIEYLTNLEYLNLNGNQITDISPLSNLVKLTNLYIGTNKITDISALQNLTNLRELYLNEDNISDISPLANLTKMYSLNLGANHNLSDLSPLSNMTGLNYLTVTESKVKDVTPIANLTDLYSLSLNYNQIEDISPLASLTSLHYFTAYVNQITDITPVANMTRLNSLKIGNNKITDLSPLANLSQLTWLEIGTNQISDINAVKDLTKLKMLNVGSNQISDISVLNNLSQLNSLFLNNNQLGNEDMEVIGGLTNLTTLFLSQNHITDIRPLASLSKMDSADFANQVIKKPARNFSKTLSVPNNITSIDGTLVTPKTISNNGTYDAPNVNWSSPSYLPEVRYTFKQDVAVGSTTSSYTGIIIQPLNEPVDYNVTFNIDGNTSEVKTVTEEDLIPEPANPTKQGYTFDGWYDAETGGTKWDFTTGQMPANDLMLYAHFSVNSYQVNFDIDGAVMNEAVVYDTLLNEPTAPTKQGYTFDGWYDAETGGNKWDFKTMKMPANDVTLYAHFTVSSYQVNFDIDGAVTNEAIVYDTLLNEPATPTKQGYTFDGWYDAETGGNKWDFKTMKMPANDVTLYAHFTINNYQANFDIDGSVTNETITYDTLLNEPTAPTKQGFLFDGWYDAEVGGTKWDFNTMKMPANDITLYAHFSKETPLIPSPSDESDSKPTNGSITINEPSATSMPAQNNNITVTAGENTPELTTAKLPKTGDNNPWQTLFAGILLSSSAFYIWRKKA
ncbi:LPXTG cell wall anchor domain-containing protein [Listeria monocytogenes]|uniref:LPXTG cell wall anchor domain-containing protein n=3 Tax=Listeria monocytogenes TaxID=1639 RepID=A0A2Z5C0T3_LISMN|nr:InlB B-repeat-containing protein [Listeria monocytogenes]EAF3077953.1 LPXTG cell wall anchor domain-containing protein [Listeria monocytogenes serotype 1/2a]EKE4576493.1 InlB B-repeat-containing protein [Listeria monocytogenes serotype 1/2b]AXB12905.1 LPXTG cell wall anchor domain-containing protein [Listeria monocytogenes]EAA0154018.1 LPXTG cell wall anchor domain-containing protein [Listeria monocytogenes]EAA0275565.1 LPXTG cell wall anchor domain-containing protein [Listeria monocytogene